MPARVPAVGITEGSTKLSVPKQSFSDPHHAEVFFNPTMRFSRSMGSLAVSALKPKSVLDGLCATGARGVRYAAENPSVKKLVVVDANPLAMPFARKNILLNKLSSKAQEVCQDFNDFCYANENSFDLIEVDPFGTPAPFMQSSVAALKKPGVLSFTSTDLANIVKKNAPTLRDYGAKPLYNEFSHETALRILLGFVARGTAAQNISCTPLLCFYEGHHVKIIVRLKKGKPERNVGFIAYCDKCHSRFLQKAKCVCGNRLLRPGPLWLGDFCDKAFLKKTLAANARRDYEDKNKIHKTLELLLHEQGFPPWFYDVHSVADKFGLSLQKKMDVLVSELRSKGFKAVRTHFTPTGIKTDAGIMDVRKVIA